MKKQKVQATIIFKETDTQEEIMYTFKKPNILIPVFLLLSTQAYQVNAFSFREVFEDMDHSFRHMQQELKSRFHTQQQLSEEDQTLINKQLEIVAKIKPEITKNENGLVTIAFPIENIDKNKIELSLEHGLLNGIIPLDHGSFRFVVHSNFIKCEYVIDIKKEQIQEPMKTTDASTTQAPKRQTGTQDTSTPNDKQAVDTEIAAQTNAIHWRTSNYFTEALPLEIDLSKVKLSDTGTAETKNNKLFIRLEPKSYARLKIRHA